MYQGDDMKIFYRTLRKLSKYDNAKSGSLVQSIMIGDEIVEDSKIIAEVVAKEVLMNDETNDKEVMAFPKFKKGDFYNSVLFYAGG